ncbi:hypothetical protein SARC_15302, partial [Sphaeroforma arctica JP610]
NPLHVAEADKCATQWLKRLKPNITDIEIAEKLRKRGGKGMENLASVADAKWSDVAL